MGLKRGGFDICIGKIKETIKESIEVKNKILENEELIFTIHKVAQEIINAFRNDKKVLLCGNDGSAADAQHIAAELSGRFYFDRKPLFAEALHVNTSYLTAVANDYSYEEVFSRLVEAKGMIYLLAYPHLKIQKMLSELLKLQTILV